MVERVALIDLSDDRCSVLRLLGASHLSVSRRGTGLVDPVTGQFSDLYRIVVRGDLGEQGAKAIHDGNIDGASLDDLVVTPSEGPEVRHKSLRSDDYLFERSTFEYDQTLRSIAPTANGHVEGVYLDAGDDQMASWSRRFSASLDLYRSARIKDQLDAAQYNDGVNDPSTDDVFARSLLRYQAILIHLDCSSPNFTANYETVLDLLARTAASVGDSIGRKAIRTCRIVLAVGEIGRLRLNEGSVCSLVSMPSAELFRMSHDAVSVSWPALLNSLSNLASTIERLDEDGRVCPFLFVPYDYFGDVVGHECLNRDPLDYDRNLFSVIDTKDADPPTNALWRPFNLADTIFASTISDVQSTSVFQIEP